MTSSRGAIRGPTGGMQLPARDRDDVCWETPEARPERGPTRSTSAGLGMGVTWPVSPKQRLASFCRRIILHRRPSRRGNSSRD